MNTRPKKPDSKIRIYTDGAIRPEQGISGLGAIVRNEAGTIYYWWSSKAGSLTCNEAEYAAVIFALEQLRRLKGYQYILEIEIVSDSRVLVEQMSGRASAHAPTLRKMRSRLQGLVAGFRNVSFRHIPREQNRLADALAFEAVSGDVCPDPRPASACPHPETWEQLIQLWRLP